MKRIAGKTTSEGSATEHQSANTIRMPQGQMLSDHPAKGHTNDIQGVVTKSIQQGSRVVGILLHHLGAIRLPGLAQSTLIVRDNVTC